MVPDVSAPILVLGGSGQVATALGRRGGTRMRVVGRPELDFERPETLAALAAGPAPALLVNAAAYTAVDRAETEPEQARRANADGPAALAQWCDRIGIPMIHISTDYVFDGRKGAPYVETDLTCPESVYGATKLAGEQAVLAACRQAIVLRTSWVYAATGRNFVLTMLGAARKTDTLRVVADQVGCPTAADDLAAAILEVAAQTATGGWRPEYAGVFHACGTGSTSWHGLAEAVFQAAAPHGLRVPTVTPIATADWPTPARRPVDSRLACDRLEQVFGIRLPDWRGSVTDVVDQALAAAPAGG